MGASISVLDEHRSIEMRGLYLTSPVNVMVGRDGMKGMSPDIDHRLFHAGVLSIPNPTPAHLHLPHLSHGVHPHLLLIETNANL